MYFQKEERKKGKGKRERERDGWDQILIQPADRKSTNVIISVNDSLKTFSLFFQCFPNKRKLRNKKSCIQNAMQKQKSPLLKGVALFCFDFKFLD